MIKLICIFILSSAVFVAHGQGSFQGTVTDDQNQPLIGATVLLQETGEGVAADENGRFKINNLKEGTYKVRTSFIGYISDILSVEIINDEIAKQDIQLKEGSIHLSDVTITASPENSFNTLSQVDIRLRPVNTSQDILRMAPGLFIAQHSGGGKAEQIFLRGFDADHGTDINVEVDGLPVNMVSHAHGQGYADLHFLIPELVQYVDFDKGPYFADKGDLNTAGHVSFQTKDKLDRDFIKMEGGSFGSLRSAGGLNIPMKSQKANAYIAGEFFRSDGFFIHTQKFNRINFQSKFNIQLSSVTRLSAGLTAFNSYWDASGQIPDRAVEEGTISRYGSLDPTEGGQTGRFNAFAKVDHQFRNGSSLENQVYAVRYNFSLFSNFTFFLKDSVNGDQIHQHEQRWVYGYKTQYKQTTTLWGKTLTTTAGAGLRYDKIDNIGLAHTVKREFLNDIKLGNIHEGNLNIYVSETMTLSRRFILNAALRLDYFRFSYDDYLTAGQSSAVSNAVISPKLNLSYQVSDKISLFVRSGSGFHSNDARVVVTQRGRDALPKAYGVDLGADIKLTSRLLIHTALWRLDLAQEFVYVGDEGIVEPSGKTKREGIDFSFRQQLNEWLFLDADVSLSKPRSKEEPKGENYIPLAPTFTSIGGVSFRKSNGLNGSLRYRYLADRPANEDNTVVAQGYFIADAIVNYTRPGFEIGLAVENLFNRSWKEAQFDTESRLKNETTSVSEIHFTPGTPFSWKLRVTKYF